MTLPLIASVLLSMSVLLVFVGVTAMRPASNVRERIELYVSSASLARPGAAGPTLEEVELQQSFMQRVLKPAFLRLMQMLGRIMPPARLEKLRRQLDMAGNPGGVTPAQFFGFKIISLIFMGSLVALRLMTGPPPSLFLTIGLVVYVLISFRIPDIWLSIRVKRRQELMTNQMPDALDMLTIAVEAGLSFDQGIGEIVNRWKNELSGEFQRVLLEIGVGTSRREALYHLRDRTGVPDIASFVVAINHSEDLGTSLGRVLQQQSEEMRTKRRQRAQERANKVPIKMMFPLAFFIFPALFAVILGPAVPRIMRGFASVGP
ncbi:MAG TPA: type II secretion system F family protein [Herpetosiphonaceae bacterium]|nr:type II secretion system F family protein [Herpetosiphonaceae bacterium]